MIFGTKLSERVYVFLESAVTGSGMNMTGVWVKNRKQKKDNVLYLIS